MRAAKHGDDLVLWAHRRVVAKNTLTTEDAIAVEGAYEQLLTHSDDAMAEISSAQSPNVPIQQLPDDSNRDFPKAVKLTTLSAPPENDAAITATRDRQTAAKINVTSPLIKTSRKRNKAHLAFVAAQPCLICKRSPCDAHHLKFAQPRSLGRKVSDEFTVPLCREHHQDLHRHGNELAWWANVQITPLPVATELWRQHCFKPSHPEEVHRGSI